MPAYSEVGRDLANHTLFALNQVRGRAAEVFFVRERIRVEKRVRTITLD